MRRETRPFVVEVRRGQKKPQPAPTPAPLVEPSSDDEMMRRAEAALFGRIEPAPDAAPAAQPAQPPRRILEAIAPEAPASEHAPAVGEAEPKRRGRKPGSKNRPKEILQAVAQPQPKRRRGRPPKNPEGQVRSVTVTPELANAALETMARSNVPAPVSPVPARIIEQTAAPAASPVVITKRPRGRPRKNPLVAKPDAVTTKEPLAPLSPGVMDPARIVTRYAPGASARAGQRWSRRLRSFAHPGHVNRRRSRS